VKRVEQALLATKAVNEKARTAAYSLLVEIGRCYVQWHPELTQQGCLCLAVIQTVFFDCSFVIDRKLYVFESYSAACDAFVL